MSTDGSVKVELNHSMDKGKKGRWRVEASAEKFMKKGGDICIFEL